MIKQTNRSGIVMAFSLGEIAEAIDGSVVGDGEIIINGINSLDEADNGDISFFSDPRYSESLANTRASAIIVAKKNDSFSGPQIIVDNPSLAYARTARIFEPPVPRHEGVSEKSFVHENAKIGLNVSIYPMVYVEKNAVIDDDVVLFPGVFIGEDVRIGTGSVIYPNVSILRGSVIGRNVIIHSGTVIGSDGFRFVQEGGVSIKAPQLGTVQIDDDVELGANNCIDRAAFGKTWIKRGVKTDNMVQIAHNVVVGEDTVIVAQAGISGSVNIGRGVMMGGQVGIVDHLSIGDGAMIASQAGIVKSIAPGEIVSGSPAIPHRQNAKVAAILPKLPKLSQRVRRLEKAMEKLLEKEEKE
jgi:UDP-3-O-[3-hydroxymyristoyl] glucosamine N-acyltransferase